MSNVLICTRKILQLNKFSEIKSLYRVKCFRNILANDRGERILQFFISTLFAIENLIFKEWKFYSKQISIEQLVAVFSTVTV